MAGSRRNDLALSERKREKHGPGMDCCVGFIVVRESKSGKEGSRKGEGEEKVVREGGKGGGDIRDEC